LGIDRNGGNRDQSLLIIGGAGGVGSIAIQLAKLAGLSLIATASRPKTVHWMLDLGADEVIDHSQPIHTQLFALGRKEVDFIANFSNTDAYWEAMADIVGPEERIVSIVENPKPLDLNLLKSKSVTFVWEFMFTALDVPDAGHGQSRAASQ
jgi:NADPH:quinone reductase-like Zn-dependent oxidoreductase